MKFNTVTICEAEGQAYIEGKGHDNYITARHTAMCRSIQAAYRLAQWEVKRSLGRQSPTGGVPIWKSVTINGVESVE